MNGGLPFDALLDELTGADLPIGPRERIAFARLLTRYDGTSRRELRAATAALLARSSAEVEIIETIFDRLYPEVEPAPPGWGERARALWRQARWVVAAIALSGVAAGGYWVVFGSRPQGANAQPAEPTRWPPWVAPTATLAASALVAGALVALLLWALRRGRRRLTDDRRRLQRGQLVALPGARWYPSAPAPEPFSRAMLDDLSAILGAAIRESEGAEELDVDRTVDATARAALIPTLVHRRRLGHPHAVVLEDVGVASRSFHARTEAFAQGLHRRGIDVERLWFDRNLSRVSVRRGGRLAPIASLAARIGGLPLIVVSTGDGISEAARDPREELRAALRAWPARVLLNPIEDADLWPGGLMAATAPMAAYPLNARGVLAAARQLTALRTHRRAREPSPRAVGPPLDFADVQALRAMAAMVQRPSFELAQALRRRFLPHAPEDVVLAVAALVDGSPTDDERRAVDDAVRWFRERGPEREVEVRRFLLERLAEQRPPNEASAAFLRWRMDVEFQRFHDEDAREDARAELSRLSDGPLGAEIRDHLLETIEAERRRGDERGEALQGLLETLDPLPDTGGVRVPNFLAETFAWAVFVAYAGIATTATVERLFLGDRYVLHAVPFISLQGHSTVWTLVGGVVCTAVVRAAVFVLDRFQLRQRAFHRWWARSLLLMIAIYTAQLVAGLLFNVLLGWGIWDYSHYVWRGIPLHLLGQITLVYAPAWFLVGLILPPIYGAFYAVTPYSASNGLTAIADASGVPPAVQGPINFLAETVTWTVLTAYVDVAISATFERLSLGDRYVLHAVPFISLQGHTTVWWLVGGVACTAVVRAALFVLDRFQLRERAFHRWWARSLLLMIAIYTAQLVAGLLFNVLLGWGIWDYSHYVWRGIPLHLLGQITLVYAPAWFLAGLFYIPFTVPSARTAPEGVFPSTPRTPTPTRASVRGLLAQIFRTDSDFDAFCHDFFESVHARFFSGMDRVEKINLLLVHVDPADILACLRKYDPRGVKENEHLIEIE